MIRLLLVLSQNVLSVQTYIVPRLKTSAADVENLKSYRPIANLCIVFTVHVE